MSKGKGGFNNIGVYLDVCSQHVSVFKYKKAGMGFTTIVALRNIGDTYTDPKTFMADGRSHFNNHLLHDDKHATTLDGFSWIFHNSIRCNIHLLDRKSVV